MEKCKQCGTCCRKGGPTLHKRDLSLIKEDKLPISSLVTIRQGEPVFSPISGIIEPAQHELIKVSSTNSWICPYLETSINNCQIYDDRPIECSLLQCWDTSQLAKIIYHDNLNRWDIIEPDSEISELIRRHEKDCSFKQLLTLAENRRSGNIALGSVDTIIERDLYHREKAIKHFNLSLEQELFYFGRPMFKSLEYFTGMQREIS